ncbi:MAG TPA: hypothetical protein VHW09_28780 [Bryobacteraceae bacterium]|jgi:hypothetical protein|nr:hypothetical protein [Bryobacteraceae bacterium]
MRVCLLLLTPLIAWAQFPAPEQAGVLLERDLNVDGGQFAIRAPDYQVFRYTFDPKTLVHRETLSGGMEHLRLGDHIVVVSDPVSGSLLRYARDITVSKPAPQISDARPSADRFPLLDLSPHTGNLTFAGVVARCSMQSLVLHTREGEQTVLIRHDTRYVHNGDTVEAAELHPNMRVFVRAGRNLYEQVEAYQVIWGSILDPVRK